MSGAWRAAPPAPPARRTFGFYLRLGRRGGAMGLILLGGLALLLALRLAERPIFGARRPLTPWITQGVCRASLAVLGLRRAAAGAPLRGPGALVANHISWLDIFVLNAGGRFYFVAKSEVAGWPFIGLLARATGTYFVERRGAAAGRQARALAARLSAGHQLLFFPEGTSSDGLRVLPFKSTLFAPLAEGGAAVQPVSLHYRAPPGRGAKFYGWWGDHPLAPSLAEVLGAPRQGRVEVIYHPPLRGDGFAGRKDLAAAAEAAVRAGFARLGGGGD